MPIPVTFNGVIYQVPVQGDQKWAPPLTRYLVALAAGSLQQTGGLFTLTSNVNFGATYGLLAKYFTSISANPATLGAIRLAAPDTIDWRNNAGSGNNVLSTNSSDNLVWNGTIISSGFGAGLADGKIWIGSATNLPVAQTLNGDVTVSDLGVTAIGALKIDNSMISGSAAIAYSKLNLGTSIVNSDIGASASIAYSKLSLGNSIVNADIATAAAIAFTKLAALNNSIVPVTNGSGVITSSAVTATTLGYLDATSSIQGQLNALFPTASFTDAAVTGKLLTGYVSGAGTILATSSILAAIQFLNGNQALYLPLTGGTLTGALTLANQQALILKELTANGTTAITLSAPATVTGSYNIFLPAAVGAAGSVLTDAAGTGVMSWVVPTDVDSYLPLTGGTLTGNLTMASGKALILTDSGTNTVTIEAPTTITPSSYTLKMPVAQGGATTALFNDGAGNLSWATPAGSGTVNSGTQYQLAYYAATGAAVSGDSTLTTDSSGQLIISLPAALATDITLTETVHNQKNEIVTYGQTSTNGLYIANNRDVATGVYAKTGQGSSQILIQSGNNQGVVYVQTTSTNNGSQSTVATFQDTGVSILGTTTNDSATAGNVGEYIESVFSNSAFASTGTWGDLTSISLTAGDWDVTATISVNGNNATVARVLFGISKTSGNSSTGLVDGSNELDTYIANFSNGFSAGAIPAYRVLLATTTTIYFKGLSSFSGGFTPFAVGRLSARRVR